MNMHSPAGYQLDFRWYEIKHKVVMEKVVKELFYV